LTTVVPSCLDIFNAPSFIVELEGEDELWHAKHDQDEERPDYVGCPYNPISNSVGFKGSYVAGTFELTPDEAFSFGNLKVWRYAFESAPYDNSAPLDIQIWVSGRDDSAAIGRNIYFRLGLPSVYYSDYTGQNLKTLDQMDCVFENTQNNYGSYYDRCGFHIKGTFNGPNLAQNSFCQCDLGQFFPYVDNLTYWNGPNIRSYVEDFAKNGGFDPPLRFPDVVDSQKGFARIKSITIGT
jgi:hypothetical protein